MELFKKTSFIVTYLVVYSTHVVLAIFSQLEYTGRTSGGIVAFVGICGLITSYYISKRIIKKINLEVSKPAKEQEEKVDSNDDDPEGLKVVRGAIQVVIVGFVLLFLFALAAQ